MKWLEEIVLSVRVCKVENKQFEEFEPKDLSALEKFDRVQKVRSESVQLLLDNGLEEQRKNRTLTRHSGIPRSRSNSTMQLSSAVSGKETAGANAPCHPSIISEEQNIRLVGPQTRPRMYISQSVTKSESDRQQGKLLVLSSEISTARRVDSASTSPADCPHHRESPLIQSESCHMWGWGLI